MNVAEYPGIRRADIYLFLTEWHWLVCMFLSCYKGDEYYSSSL